MPGSNTYSYWRQRGDSQDATPAPLMACVHFTFDGALANTTDTGKILPAGAAVLAIDIVSGHTGGISPAYDIGSAADPDGFVNGAVSTTTQRLGVASTEFGALTADTIPAGLTADTDITAGDDGTGTAGTGNIDAYVYYVMNDAGIGQD